MSQKDSSLSRILPEVQKVLDEGHYLYIATVKPTNKPHVTMVAYVFDGETITIVSRATSIKVRNLRRNPNVSGLIVSDDRKGVMIEGTATVYDDEKNVQRILNRYYERYPQARSRESSAQEIQRVGIEVKVRKIIKATPGW